jgi:Protein of unknown function (DUF402)
VWNAFPALVVGDGVVWLPPETPYVIGTGLFDDWAYVERVLERPQLRVTRPGDDYSVFLFADGWYVNLEQPQRPTELGFDYEDELLDVWVPFGGEPELLDEDELEEAVRRGFLSHDREAEIRAKAERIIAERPWPTGWEDWEPEPGWQVPDLPPGWESL